MTAFESLRTHAGVAAHVRQRGHRKRLHPHRDRRAVDDCNQPRPHGRRPLARHARHRPGRVPRTQGCALYFCPPYQSTPTAWPPASRPTCSPPTWPSTSCARVRALLLSIALITPDRTAAGLSPAMVATDLAEYLVRKGARAIAVHCIDHPRPHGRRPLARHARHRPGRLPRAQGCALYCCPPC